MKKTLRYTLFLASKALFLLACIITPFFLFGCSSVKSTENNTLLRDSVANHVGKDSSSVYNNKSSHDWSRDSVHVYDSVRVIVRTDTLIIDRWHTKYVLRDIGRHTADTVRIYKEKTDTVYLKKNVYLTKYKSIEVEKPMGVWQHFRMMIGDIFLLFMIIVGISCLYERKKNNRS